MKKGLWLVSIVCSIAFLVSAFTAAQEPVHWDVFDEILDEAFERSEVMENAGWLTDVYGPRNSKSSGYVDAGVSRMRPVMMAAATTILGMIPLLTDAFFIAMAVTIMVGLLVATVLTLVVVPVLYTIFFRVPYEGDTPPRAAPDG